jgi:hypothetical protein
VKQGRKAMTCVLGREGASLSLAVKVASQGKSKEKGKVCGYLGSWKRSLFMTRARNFVVAQSLR